MGNFDITTFKTKATKDKFGGHSDISTAFKKWLADQAAATDLENSEVAIAAYHATCNFLDEVNRSGYPFHDPSAEY